MPNTTTSTFMLLPVPIPGVDPGPQWATDVNTCLTTIDSHDHSTNKGTPINPSGISINADLPFGTHNATGLRSARFTAGSILSTGSDIGCLYVSGVDLYYNDVNGNQVKMTASGAVAGTPGSIGNLLSPASVTYNSGTSTFVFQSTTATAANLDAGSLTVRNLTSNSKGISIQAPAGLSNNYSFVLPANLPSSGSSQKILTIDQTGNLFDAYDVDNTSLQVTSNLISVKNFGVTQTMRAVATSGFSTGSGPASTLSTSYVDIPNCSINLTTSGRPVLLMMQATSAGFTMSNGPTVTAAMSVRYTRDGSEIGAWSQSVNNSTVTVVFASSFPFIDFSAPAGSHIYKAQYMTSGGSVVEMDSAALAAVEL